MITNEQDALGLLKRVLLEKRLCLFAGSGISVDSGLPDWKGFMKYYLDLCKNFNDNVSRVDPKLNFSRVIEDAKTHNNPIESITALKSNIDQLQKEGYSTDTVNNALIQFFSNKAPNDYHRVIVNTNYNHIVTTNYDNLLEIAAEEEGHPDLNVRSYGYNETDKIASSIFQNHSSIIHAHGKINDLKIDNIVLTQQDYLHIMKERPAFRLIINSLFITNSILFVGYGASDPHFEDVIDSVNSTMQWDLERNDLATCYIMMKEDSVNSIREALVQYKRVVIIPFSDYPKMLKFLEELHKEAPRPCI